MAILANELRIGNFVSFNIHSKQITDFEILEYSSRNGNHIPLTPEILGSSKVMYKHFADEFFIRIVSGGVLIGQRKKGIKYLKHIKYVHQLQNLYFALTGEELTINF